MKFLVAVIYATSALFSLCVVAGETTHLQPMEHRVIKKYDVSAIYFDNENRKLYVFGYMKIHYLDIDSVPTTEEPKVLRISEDGKYEAEINAAFFGLEQYAEEEHAHDGKTTQTWFVDTAHSRILRFKGNPSDAANAIAPLLARGPNIENFFTPGKMPRYGFQVSIAGSPPRMWIVPRTGGGGPYALARDEKNNLLWEGDEGVLRVYSDVNSQPVSHQLNDFVARIFPDERDGTAWVYFSHRGELDHMDRNGDTLHKIPIAKFLTSDGAQNKIIVDFERKQVWYADVGYPFKLVQLSLSGEHKLELNFQQISGAKKDACFNASLALQDDGKIWLYCQGSEIYKLDFSGERILIVEPVGLPQH